MIINIMRLLIFTTIIIIILEPELGKTSWSNLYITVWIF